MAFLIQSISWLERPSWAKLGVRIGKTQSSLGIALLDWNLTAWYNWWPGYIAYISLCALAVHTVLQIYWITEVLNRKETGTFCCFTYQVFYSGRCFPDLGWAEQDVCVPLWSKWWKRSEVSSREFPVSVWFPDWSSWAPTRPRPGLKALRQEPRAAQSVRNSAARAPAFLAWSPCP